MAEAARKLFAERHVDPHTLSVPSGFRVEVIATGLNNPCGIDFDEDGNIFVAEMGSPDVLSYAPGRIVRIRDDGSQAVVADRFAGSLTGIVFYEGAFYVMEHGYEGRMHRVFEDGEHRVIVDGLPGGGDHPATDIVVAHSERLYFGQGTRTNSGVVGRDNIEWLNESPELHDIPGTDVTLTGSNFESENPLGPGVLSTGAFKPYGVTTQDGEVIHGSMKCSGGIVRVDPDGGGLELFSWGLRRPCGLSVHPDGRIYCTDTGMEDRGSRRVKDGKEYIWQLHAHTWYGWPDYSGGEPVTNPEFRPDGGEQTEFLLRDHLPVPERPVLTFPAGSGLGRFDFARSSLFGTSSTAFLPLMGDLHDPNGGQACKLLTANVTTGEVEDFICNRHPGTASAQGSGGFERPIAAKFDRTGEALCVLDLGIVETGADGRLRTLPNTGVIWRIVPEVLA